MEGRKVIQNNLHGFTKDKSCLNNLVAFYSGVNTVVNKGKAPDVFLCKTFDTVPHTILFSKLERGGFDE
ncbi:hypothetical protein HGM15179_009172 [Zosterops borbonicus]|uniref:Rna-directed dna polymerase from mobile element jockey-like n=1 Tax=Zosterops borbonicus TaxID=364589 RepID=A0A8K1GHY8_9PASS|nr:hypothetical protein HGM15179_009172 [Zosterops borbonicus]